MEKPYMQGRFDAISYIDESARKHNRQKTKSLYICRLILETILCLYQMIQDYRFIALQVFSIAQLQPTNSIGLYRYWMP